MPTHALPPGPSTPKALNGALFLLVRGQFMRRLQRRYGDAFTLAMPVIGKAVVVCNPDLVKTVFTAKPTVLHGGKNPLGRTLGPGSIFSMDEDRHLEERRMLLPPFHGERMRSYESLVEEEALRAMSDWCDEEAFATLPSFNRITLRVILRAVFGAAGRELVELERILPPLTAVGQRLTTAPFLGRDLGRRSPGGRFRRLRSEYNAVVSTLIDQHLADADLAEREDVLALILTSLQGAGDEVDHAAVADELLTLLVAGHETTASSLAWAVERLGRHPEILRRLEDEVVAGGSELRAATILELQRHRTIISATGRRAMQPFELGDWIIPPGTTLIAAAAMVHTDDRFHEDASGFDPDRYLGTSPGTYSWIPFGGGTRRCLGAAFAQMEMDIVLRTLLANFELLPSTDPPERESFRGVAYAPAKGGIGRFRRRATPLETGSATAAQCPMAMK